MKRNKKIRWKSNPPKIMTSITMTALCLPKQYQKEKDHTRCKSLHLEAGLGKRLNSDIELVLNDLSPHAFIK